MKVGESFSLDKRTFQKYNKSIRELGREDECIEVKTTHTEQRSFIMSEAEFKFAMDNSKNYKLYLIVNIGSGPDSYKIIIDNFKQDCGKRLRTISKCLIYE